MKKFLKILEIAVWVAMTGGLPGTVAPLRELLADVLPDERMLIWNTVTPTGDILVPNHGRMGQAQVLREAFLNSVQPDLIHSSSVIEGATESSVTTLNRHFDGPRTSATLYDLIPLLDSRRTLDSEVSSSRQSVVWLTSRLSVLMLTERLCASICLSVLYIRQIPVVSRTTVPPGGVYRSSDGGTTWTASSA